MKPTRRAFHLQPAEVSPYRDRRAALATKHGKQRPLAWPLGRGAGLSLCVPGMLDTDQFGTFTGEIKRPGTAAEVARRKARLGMIATGLPLGLASEGTFGPHPLSPLLPANNERLLFVDDLEGYSVEEEIVTGQTNYGRIECASFAEAAAFAERSGFPSHGLIVRPVGNGDPARICKGIVSADALARAFASAVDASPEDRVTMETDMRAHMNPTRLRILRRLGASLARRLRTLCPGCACPGFGRVGGEPGLPCADCGRPSAMLRWEIHACPRCGERRRLSRSDGQRSAPAQHCAFCNP